MRDRSQLRSSSTRPGNSLIIEQLLSACYLCSLTFPLDAQELLHQATEVVADQNRSGEASNASVADANTSLPPETPSEVSNIPAGGETTNPETHTPEVILSNRTKAKPLLWSNIFASTPLHHICFAYLGSSRTRSY